MAKFFTQPSDALFEQAAQVTEYQNSKKFNPADVAHARLLHESSLLVKQKLQELQTIDKKMAIGFIIGTAGFVLSWLLPFAAIATAGFAYGAYQLGLRQQAYKEYTTALETLSKCCIWTLGETTDASLGSNRAIHEMMTTLAPLTSPEQLREFIDDSIEDHLVDEAAAVREQDTAFLDTHLSGEQATLHYKIYGYQQGGFLSVMQGIGYAIKNAFITLKNALRKQPEATATATMADAHATGTAPNTVDHHSDEPGVDGGVTATR